MSLDNNPQSKIGGWTPSTETAPSTVEKKGFSTKQKIIAGISGTALALGIGAGLKSMNNNDGEQITPVSPAATAPVTPSPTESPTTSPETTSNYPASILQSEQFKALTPEQQVKIEKIHAIQDLADFYALPKPEQEMYGLFVYDVYKDYAKQQIKSAGISGADYVDPSAPITKASSGQDVLEFEDLRRATTYWLMAKPTAPYEINKDNVLDAKKMQSIRFVDPASAECTMTLEQIDRAASTGSLTATDDGYYADTAMDEKTNPDGTLTIDVLYNAITDTAVYEFATVKDVSGKTVVVPMILHWNRQ